MKAFVLFILLVVSFSASAQTSNLHMIEMSTNNAALGNFGFSDSGSSGSATRHSTFLSVGGNYAYRIAPRIQLGLRGNYSKFESTGIASENYDLSVGGIYNFKDEITEAMYLSVYTGMRWFHSYGNPSSSHIEQVNGTIALGKRIPLTNIGLATVTYSPEISYSRSEQTKNSTFSVNSYTIRFLQFSVFF